LPGLDLVAFADAVAAIAARVERGVVVPKLPRTREDT
jgi:hypothetical protein